MAGTDARISLEGPWKILIGDDSGYSLPGHNDSSWEETTLPGSVTGYVREKTGGITGTLWLRKELFIDRNLEGTPLGLILGRISNADETFFNGVKVGGTGGFPPDEFSMWNHPRHYPVPASIVRFGESNTIAIRVSYFLYAGILGDIALAPHGQWRADEIDRRFSVITHSYLILSMALLLLVVFLAFYIARPDEQEYLFYCLQIFFGFFIVFDLCTYWNIYPSTYFRLQTVGISWVALNVAHLIFLHRIYRLERRRVEIALWAYLAVWTLLVFLFARRDPVTYGIILILLCTVLGFYHISCHIYALVRGRSYARIFSVFGLSVILCSMHDSFVYLGMFYGKILTLFGYTFDRMIFHYGAFALFLGTALVLVYRFLTLREEVDDLNRNLEKYIIEDAVLRQSGDDRSGRERASAIAPQTEEKIKRVIDYINENYIHNLSREGLAASVDMHPDNLSKLFNAYKNMRIGDYINELRIRDAAERLRADGENVIDIAFSTGFESLRTFNRAFKKYTGTTPEKYRLDPGA